MSINLTKVIASSYSALSNQSLHVLNFKESEMIVTKNDAMISWFFNSYTSYKPDEGFSEHRPKCTVYTLLVCLFKGDQRFCPAEQKSTNNY